MSIDHGNIFERGRRLKRLLAISATALLVSLPLTMPAQASPVAGSEIQPGHNITVFHNLDFIAVFGYAEGEQLTVEVFRGDHQIGSAFGQTVETPEGFGLEVNHGPAGAPVQGDCWEEFTPDVLPGDRVVVTSAGGTVTEEVLVDDITMKAPKDVTATADPSDVVVEGRASFANGTPIPVEELNSGELRQPTPRFRATPNTVERIPGTTDGWRATYEAPYQIVQMPQPLTAQQQKSAILNGDHAMGYGHVAPLPAETQVVDGLGGGGPALGCEQAPKQSNAVAASDDPVVNTVSGPLNLSGFAMADISGVEVTLSDGDAATTDPTVAATNLSAGAGEKTWSVQFSRAELEALNDGTLTATGAYTISGGGNERTTGATLELQKDTVVPANATADPAGGLFNSDQSVTLTSAEEGSTIRYTTGDGSQADPTTTTGQVYGSQIQVTADQTIKAIVVDAAGNPSSVSTFQYTFDRIAPGISASPANGSYDTAQSLTLSSNEQNVSFFYTTDGSAPDRSSQAYGGPIQVNQSRTIKAIAYDQAGNASQVIERNITIRTASTTTLNVASADLKLGRSRTISGLVRPGDVGGSVRITIDRPGTLPNATRRLQLDSISRYGFSYTPTAPGTYRITASYAKTDTVLGSTSVMKSFRVIR